MLVYQRVSNCCRSAPKLSHFSLQIRHWASQFAVCSPLIGDILRKGNGHNPFLGFVIFVSHITLNQKYSKIRWLLHVDWIFPCFFLPSSWNAHPNGSSDHFLRLHQIGDTGMASAVDSVHSVDSVDPACFWAGDGSVIWFWVNYNNSLTWIKAIWGWFPLINHDFQWGRSEVVIIYPDDYTIGKYWEYNIISQ